MYHSEGINKNIQKQVDEIGCLKMHSESVNPLLNFWTILEPVCSFKEFAQETPVTAHPSDFAQAQVTAGTQK